MADTVEQVIYRLSVDGSAYIDGVDAAVNSTKKLSAEQEKNNQIIKQLKAANIGLAEETKVLSAEYNKNAKQLRELISMQEKASGPAAKQLLASVKSLAEHQGKLSAAIIENKDLLKKSAVEIKAYEKANKDAEKANAGFVVGLQKTHAGLSRVAALIPGVGLGSMAALIAGPLVNAFTDWYTSISTTTDSLKLLKKATEESFSAGGSAFVEASENVSELRLNVELAKQGFIDKEAVVKQYNDTMGKTAGTVKTLDEVEQKLVEHGDAYIQMMLLKAAAHFALESAAKAAFEAEEKTRKKAEEFLTTGEKAISFFGGLSSAPGAIPAGIQKQQQAQAEAARKAAAEREKKAAIKESEDRKNTFAAIAEKFQKDAAKIAEEHGFNFLPPPKPEKTTAARKEIVNIYEQELQKLRADIAKLDEKGFTDEATITKAVEEDFKKRSLAFEKAFRNKQLTKSQLSSLNSYLKDLQSLTLEQNLKTFREQKAAYLQQIENELNTLQVEENTKRIATIQDRFERERQMIISETEKTINALSTRRDKLISDISKNAAKNGLTPADIAPQIENIKTTYSKLLDDLDIIKNQKLQQLSFDTFEKISDDLQRRLKDKNLTLSALSLSEIQKQTDLFQAGKISYEQYQKELTRIAKEESDKRRENEIANLRVEIGRRQAELRSNRNLTNEQQERLLNEIRDKEGEIDNLQKGDKPDKPGDTTNKRIDNIVRYTQAIGDLASKVISFWQQANAAESAALDRSIALQERRVDAAQRIAERGNAQYLKLEEDRLNELNVKKENAARKQLGINAALQASEILVALISGLAQAAKTTGPLGAILGVTVVAAAIAGAFALAQSLKPPTPTFFKGTEDTGPGGKADDKGGFHAVLHPHERVLTAEENKKLKGISNRELVETVNMIHQVKSIPQPDYRRIKETAELKINNDGRMVVAIGEQNKLLMENNDLQRVTIRALKSMGVNVNMDKNGFAMSFLEVAEQIKIDKHV